MKSKQEDMLSNKDNKQRFINMLGPVWNTLDAKHVMPRVMQMFGSWRQPYNMQCPDKLSWLSMTHICWCFCVFMSNKILQARDQVRNIEETTMLEHVQRMLGSAVCNNLLFAHATIGCDTTSRVFSIGKGLALKHIRSDNYFTAQAEIFLQENATFADISSAGEAALVCLCTAAVGDTLNILRLQRFHQNVPPISQ